MSKMTWLMCARPRGAVGLILNVSEATVSAAENQDPSWVLRQVKVYGQQQQQHPQHSCPISLDHMSHPSHGRLTNNLVSTQHENAAQRIKEQCMSAECQVWVC